MLSKVAHLTSVHSIYDPRIMYKECDALRQAGYEVILIAPNEQNIVIHNDVKIISVKRQSNRLLRMTKTIWDIYKNAKRLNAHVYHIHDPELIVVGLLLKMRGSKVIYDSHENVSQQILSKDWLPPGMRKIISDMFKISERILLRSFDYVIAATPAIAEYFIDSGIKNCINVNNYPVLNNEDAEFREDAVVKDQICYVGSIAEVRGIKQMILAMGLLNDLQLILAGVFDDIKLKDECKLLPGWSKVCELGFVNRAMVMQTIKQSKVGLVLLHPIINYLDSIPTKMFEYMLAGIPVIASNFSLWKNIIEDNHCGICVDPLNVHEIADAIRYIINNPEEAKIMGENGRRLVLKKYNWSSEAEKLLVLYKKILMI